jgi:hypothetical protein
VNLLGVEVARIFSGELDAGEHSYIWNSQDLPNGMYEVRRSNEWASQKTGDGTAAMRLHSFTQLRSPSIIVINRVNINLVGFNGIKYGEWKSPSRIFP